jgi:hypothetical protein
MKYFENQNSNINSKFFKNVSFFLQFLQAFHNYESTLQVYLMKPTKPNKQLSDLASFLAHVSHCFPEELKTYPQQLIDILKKYSTVLNPEMRLVKISFLSNFLAKLVDLFVFFRELKGLL